MALDILWKTRELKSYKQEFILSSVQWNELEDQNLSWDKVRFDKQNAPDVSQQCGIYAFSVNNSHASVPDNNYIGYVGLTYRPLRTRFMEYFREQEQMKRPKLYFMLNQWGKEMNFHFAEVKDKRRSLEKIETALLDALIPPFNQKDYSARLAPAVKAAW